MKNGLEIEEIIHLQLKQNRTVNKITEQIQILAWRYKKGKKIGKEVRRLNRLERKFAKYEARLSELKANIVIGISETLPSCFSDPDVLNSEVLDEQETGE